jgi:hypothetical protein
MTGLIRPDMWAVGSVHLVAEAGKERGSPVEMDKELLAAIGEVAVEAAKLEYAIACLVVAARGWDDERPRQLMGRSGRVRREFGRLRLEQKDWLELRRLYRDASAVLNDRNALLHAVAVITSEEDSEPRLEFWHVPSDTQAQVTPASVTEHAADIARCFRRAVNLIPEAERRLAEATGTAKGP